MRLRFKTLALAALVVSIFSAAPVQAQKVKYSFDKSIDFQHYKRYAWAKNYLLTRQVPEDQKSIAESIKRSITKQLVAKSDISAVPDLSRNIADPNAIDQPAFGTPMNASDAWVSVLAGIRVTIEDAGTKKSIWIGQLSTKVKDPQHVMQTADKQIDAAMVKLLKPFPPMGSK
jgi:hypothetical protein